MWRDRLASAVVSAAASAKWSTFLCWGESCASWTINLSIPSINYVNARQSKQTKERGQAGRQRQFLSGQRLPIKQTLSSREELVCWETGKGEDRQWRIKVYTKNRGNSSHLASSALQRKLSEKEKKQIKRACALCVSEKVCAVQWTLRLRPEDRCSQSRDEHTKMTPETGSERWNKQRKFTFTFSVGEPVMTMMMKIQCCNQSHLPKWHSQSVWVIMFFFYRKK